MMACDPKDHSLPKCLYADEVCYHPQHHEREFTFAAFFRS